MSSYHVPNGGTLSGLNSSVLAVGTALFFVYLMNFGFQFLVTLILEREEQELARIKKRMLQTTKVLYWFGLASMISIYPPFYAGPHCALFAWITLGFTAVLHIFIVMDKSCKERSCWAYFYFVYHLVILIWIFLVLVVGYVWTQQQPAISSEY